MKLLKLLKTHSSPGSFLFKTLPVLPHTGPLLKQAPVVQRVRVRCQRSAGGQEVNLHFLSIDENVVLTGEGISIDENVTRERFSISPVTRPLILV